MNTFKDYVTIHVIDRCAGSCNTLNELKPLTKHISCKCKCKFDGKKRNSNQKWNNDKFECMSIKI